MPGCDGTYNGIVLEEGQEHRSDKRWNKSHGISLKILTILEILR